MTLDVFSYSITVFTFVNICDAEHREEGYDIGFGMMHNFKKSCDLVLKSNREVVTYLNGVFSCI